MGAANPYFGEQSIEERIVNADIIVNARLSTTTSEIATTTTEEWSDYYYVAVKFHLAVSEYLKGGGASSITAFTIQGGDYDTRREAEDAEPGVAASRVTTWDDREAIIFLNSDDPYDVFSASVLGANDYFLTIGDTIGDTYRDWYSLQDRHTKLWLPSAGTSGAGDDQEFLLAAPKPGKDTPTITIRELKSRIAAINAELNAGDGSEAYRNCVSNKYHLERTEHYRMNNWSGTDRRHSFEPIWPGTFMSGQPAGSEVYLYSPGLALPADKKERFWIDGRDATLFAVKLGELRPNKDYDRDGQPDGSVFDQSVVSVRPIPVGTYRFNHHVILWRYLACEHTSTFAITANVLAPDGTLHEAFFDPVAVGNAVAADTTNGVLNPASFTNTNGATSSIHRIAWEPGSGATGTVKMRLTPHTGITGHAVDFIALDGSVSLSLNVADATVDAANNTLTWPAPSQPWQSGDKLMLRIREAPTPVAMSDPPAGVASPEPTESNSVQDTMVHSSSIYLGPSSLEERILASPVIVRARLDSASSTVEYGTTSYGAKYLATLEFRFSVLEYLKGRGANDIVAVWDAAPDFDTRQEAEAALPAISAARNTRWDGYEAIVFLQHSVSYLPSTQQADRYYLSLEHSATDDGYSIASRYSKLWLPSEAAVATSSQSSGDQQRFLLDVPPATGSAPTIKLGEVKARIAAVTAKLAASDGSEEYMQCVTDSYFLERLDRHLRETRPERLNTGSNISPPHVHQIGSGMAAGSVVYRLPEESDIVPYVSVQVWLDSGDEGLFDAPTPSQDYRVLTSRPLIDRIYNFYFNHRIPGPCEGWAVRYEWTVTAIAPDGTLHEAFFDPITDGNAVAADSTNGVLKPAAFADANGATSTIQRIAWEPGSVQMKLSPHTGITGQVADFIALDGSVSLSLNVADATINAANNTLTWPAPSQPWHTGDKLMLRIRDAR